MRTFYENFEKIESHNKKVNESYQQGLNKYSHLSFLRRLAQHAGLKVPTRHKRSLSKMPRYINVNATLPAFGD